MATKKMKNSQKAKRKTSSKKKTNRCWPGYEPTPGKKPDSKGSCKPKKS